MNGKAKQSIKIHMTNRIRQSSVEEKTAITVPGVFYRDHKNSYIRYQEKQSAGEIKTIMKFSAKELLLLRTGATQVRVHFFKNGNRSTATIGLTSGKIIFDSEVIHYKEKVDENLGLIKEVDLQYKLWDADEQIGFYHITMKVEVD